LEPTRLRRRVLRVRTGDLPLRVLRRFMEEDLWKNREELIAMVMVFSKRKRNTCM
jgi:hypothetical protein